MPRKKHEDHTYLGGAAFARARKQFQVLYEKEGTFDGAYKNLELILWPEMIDENGDPMRPPEHILRKWCVEHDEGKSDIPEKLRRAFLARYDAFVEAHVRDAMVENAKTSKAMAIQAREGRLHPSKASQYAHANNATSFMFKETMGRSKTDTAPKRIAGMKFLAPKKRQPKQLAEPTVNGEFRVVS